MTYHAELPPSGAERWMRCPGSRNALRGFPRRSSIFAAEGTIAHHVRSLCLEFDLDVKSFVGQSFRADGFSFTVDPSWVKYLQPGIDRLREFPGKLYVEKRVDVHAWAKECDGTLDAGILHDDFILINDLKFGAGKQVYPEANKQLMIYALGFWENIARHKTNTNKVILEIDQPRAGGISTWETTVDELCDFGDLIKAAAKASRQPNAPRIASAEACEWCDFALRCREHTDFNLATVSMLFDDLDVVAPPILPRVQTLTPERRSYILRNTKVFKSWLDKLHADAYQDLLAGRPVPGFKLVDGKLGNRVWGDVTDAEEQLLMMLPKTKVYDQSVISPTTAEKLLKTDEWEKVKKLITRTPGTPTMAPEESPKEGIDGVVAMFETIDD